MSFFDRFRKRQDDAAPATPDTPAPASTSAVPASSAEPEPQASPEPAFPEPPALEPQPAVVTAGEQLSLPPQDNGGQPIPAGAPAQPSVRVYDEYGRELYISVEEWRAKVLPGALQAALSTNPPDIDQLGAVITDALEMGLPTDVLGAAEQLAAVDPYPERGAVLYAAALRESGNPVAAERVLRDAIDRSQPSGLLLLNLAQAQHRQGRQEESDATMWRAVEADPNLPQPLGWYAQRAREQAILALPGISEETRQTAGQEAWTRALEHVATLPGAWLPWIWMAKAALERNELAMAIALYENALGRVGRPVPGPMLQSLSGDLGQHGHLHEALRLALPLYDPAAHGLGVGNNIVKLLVDTGDTAAARKRVAELYAQNRTDWGGTLNFWEQEISRQELATQQTAMQPQLSFLSIEGPVWLPQGAAARTLYPDTSNARARVLFLGSSVSFPQGAAPPEGVQMPDAAGRLSRALPLFLSEGAYLLLGLDTADFLPWSNVGGFAVLGGEWPDAEAANMAAHAGAGLAVVSHLTLEEGTLETPVVPDPEGVVGTPSAPAARIRLRVLRVTGRPAEGAQASFEVLATRELPMHWDELPSVVLSAWGQLAHELVRATGDNPTPLRADRYGLPRGADLGGYLLRLEQCLAVRCAGTHVAPGQPSAVGQYFLTGEREIVRGQLDLALRYPNSVPARLLLHETLLRLRDLQPAVAAEFRQGVELLANRNPLPDPEVNGVLQQQLHTIYG